MNRDHPFVDGNKRFAITAMLVFLGRNNAILIANDAELLEFSLSVAEGSLGQDGACEFASVRVFEGDWTQDDIDEWIERVDEHAGEGWRIGEALAAWNDGSRPRFIALQGKDIESALRLASPST